MASDQLKEAKSALFDSDVYKGPTKEIEVGPVTLEIRCPRVKHSIKNLSDVDSAVQLQASADLRELFLDCVYLAETGEPFFEDTDFELLEQSSGHDNGIVSRISEAIQKLSKESAKGVEEAEGN